MPTGAKLVGSLLFFAVAWYAALQVIPTFPEGTPMRYFPLTIACIGLWQGWYVMGNRAGAGFSAAIANGLRVSVQIAFFGLLLFSLRTMFIRSAGGTYGADPFSAVVAALELYVEYFLQSLTIEIWGALFVGGIIGGIGTEMAARAWR